MPARHFPPPWSVEDIARPGEDTIAVDIHHPGRTMAACSLCLIRSFGAVWAAADGLPAVKRGIFLGRLVAQLQLRGSCFSNADVDDAVRLALKDLIQKSAA